MKLYKLAIQAHSNAPSTMAAIPRLSSVAAANNPPAPIGDFVAPEQAGSAFVAQIRGVKPYSTPRPVLQPGVNLLGTTYDHTVGFLEIVGRPPRTGDVVIRSTTSGYVTHTYLGTAWTPATPQIAPGQAVYVASAAGTAAPTLFIARAQSSVQVSWTGTPVAWVLESSPAMAGGASWTTVNIAPTSSPYDRESVLVPNDAPQQFFRLRKN